MFVGEVWISINLGASGIWGVYVFMFEEFGLDGNYMLEVMVMVEVVDLNGSGDLLDIWVFDLFDNSVVFGSEGIGNFFGSVLDVVVKFGFFLVIGGKMYFVDVCKCNVNNMFLANFGCYWFYVCVALK